MTDKKKRLRVVQVNVQLGLVWDDGKDLLPCPTEPMAVDATKVPQLGELIMEAVAQLEANGAP